MLKPSTGWSFPTTGGRLLLNPDPTGNAGGGSAPAPAPAPAPSPAPPSPTPASPPPPEPNRTQIAPAAEAGRDPSFASGFRPAELQQPEPQNPAPTAQGGQAPATPAPTDPNNQWQSVRDAAGRMGYQFGADVTDDAAALLHLVNAARQAQQSQQVDYHRELGRQLAPHAQQIQTYLQQQRQPQTQAAPERQPWEAPEWDQRWSALVERDPNTGVVLPKPGTPPEIAAKANEYVKWREEYERDPAAMISKMVEAKAEAIADRKFQENYAVHQERAQVQSILQTNSEWLYQKDATGRVAIDQAGRPQLSPVGAAYAQQVQALRSSGVTNPVVLDRMAQQLTHAQLLISQAGKAQQAAPGVQPPPQAYVQPQVNVGQAMYPGSAAPPPAYTPPSSAGLSLHDMLQRDMLAAGITDADIARDYRA